jgi:hypothetical protein
MIRKLMVIYAIAVAMVIVYFILRIFFPQNKAIELKHFNTKTEAVKEVHKDKEAHTKKETQVQQGFMLLPQK